MLLKMNEGKCVAALVIVKRAFWVAVSNAAWNPRRSEVEVPAAMVSIMAKTEQLVVDCRTIASYRHSCASASLQCLPQNLHFETKC